MPAVTLKMIAKELSLSVATVSKALANSYEISEGTKNVVLEAARNMGYIANPYASSLRKRRSKTVAVVIPEIADSFFAKVINGIEEVALFYGYHVLIYMTHESLSREQAIMQDFRSGRVDGILMSVSEETDDVEHIKAVMDTNTPVVFFDRVREELPTTCVVTNDFESSYTATKHLISKNCQKIAFVGNSTNLAINRNRVSGYLSALKDHDMICDNVLICDKDPKSDYRILSSLFENSEKPDGIILSVEKLIPLLYQVCQDLNIKIPDQLKVLTFTNFAMAKFLNPPLTTINQPAYDIGKVAAQTLFKKLARSSHISEAESIVLPSEIIFRESSN
jgi:LacI family transcriptional regulator